MEAHLSHTGTHNPDHRPEVREDEWAAADKLLAHVYPTWPEQHIPNHGILRGAIAAALRQPAPPIEPVGMREAAQEFADHFDSIPMATQVADSWHKLKAALQPSGEGKE